MIKGRMSRSYSRLEDAIRRAEHWLGAYGASASYVIKLSPKGGYDTDIEFNDGPEYWPPDGEELLMRIRRK